MMRRLSPRIVGGAMIGPLLNGLVNYEYWLPVPGSLINKSTR